MPAWIWLAVALACILASVWLDYTTERRNRRNRSSIEQERIARERIYGPENRWPLR